ncbi:MULTISPECIES: helix-turn-helix transcriptional regulator [Paenibacillus]|jgi:transcriptional regulator with XRE-family HTH domain|uniref:helix-turn-helix domain-containing protein n=1 Tax=Paenibacillus TaxID=44249 RepID=UPI00240DEC8C|nr:MULTISPECIES: helix-turn-helix transcriptional regulator [Paenibacillus]MCI1777706.1 helix-turn-helix transcriptional regulator [Paenibacillus lautus]WFB57645.1 helix-turn-helix transcriptional regulator [Paenibacillus sp. BR1-192]
MTSFNERLRELRSRKKISQQELSDRLGFNRATYARYETGNTQPDFDTLKKLADFFEVSTDYLLGRTDKPRSSIQSDGFDEKEQAEFEAFINNPEHGIFFKDYLDAPEERREEMRIIFKALMEKERDRKPGQRQGE